MNKPAKPMLKIERKLIDLLRISFASKQICWQCFGCYNAQYNDSKMGHWACSVGRIYASLHASTICTCMVKSIIALLENSNMVSTMHCACVRSIAQCNVIS